MLLFPVWFRGWCFRLFLFMDRFWSVVPDRLSALPSYVFSPVCMNSADGLQQPACCPVSEWPGGSRSWIMADNSCCFLRLTFPLRLSAEWDLSSAFLECAWRGCSMARAGFPAFFISFRAIAEGFSAVRLRRLSCWRIWCKKTHINPFQASHWLFNL